MFCKSPLKLKQTEESVTTLPYPEKALIYLPSDQGGQNSLKLKEGERVVTGQKLVEGFCSSVTGKIIRIAHLPGPSGKKMISVEIATEKEELISGLKKAPEFNNLDSASILSMLNLLGLSSFSRLSAAEEIVVGAIDSDPLSVVNRQALSQQAPNLTRGLKMLSKLSGGAKLILAVPASKVTLGQNVAREFAEVLPVEEKYPESLAEIIGIRLQEKNPIRGARVYLTAEKLTAAVEALTLGKPVTEKTLTLIVGETSKNIKTRIGTRLSEILGDVELKDSDKLIVGGPFKGVAYQSAEMAITGDFDSIYVQPESEERKFVNDQCINCGSCVTECPVGLEIGLIGRFAEYSRFERCCELNVSDCVECGMCAYVCPAGRSLVQLVKLAKAEIAKKEE